jgi:hypothetical protein
MAEDDLELIAFFDLDDSPVQQPRSNGFERLDTFFANQDYGIATESAQRDEDLQEISIDRANNRVVRKYRS